MAKEKLYNIMQLTKEVLRLINEHFGVKSHILKDGRPRKC